MIRAYKFRLSPTVAQTTALTATLDLCRELYNAALQERRDGWERGKHRIGLADQQKQLPAIKADRPDLKTVFAQVLQDVVRRVDLSFSGFFGRVRRGATPGYPRFRSRRSYDSFTYPQAYRSPMRADRVFLPKIGWVRWAPWKPLDEIGRVKTLTVKREADGWYAVLSCEAPQPKPLPTTGRAVGLDLGLLNLVATSDGEILGDLAPLKAAELRLRRAQRTVSRRVKGSRRRRKAIRVLAHRHLDLARTRKAQLDRITRRIVADNDIVCIEDLNVAGLSRAGANNAQGRGLRRNIHHAAWSTLRHMLTYKAESAGRQIIAVPPAGTSQLCSACGRIVPKRLSERTHACICGLVVDRDVNAARNVLQAGLRLVRRGDALVGAPRRPEKIGEVAALAAA